MRMTVAASWGLGVQAVSVVDDTEAIAGARTMPRRTMVAAASPVDVFDLATLV